jgi:Uma2 family endonuclease
LILCRCDILDILFDILTVGVVLMPVVLLEKPVPFDNIPNRIRWSVQQCDALRDAGFLRGRYELIDGEIILKMGQGPRHAYVVNLIMTWLANTFGAARVRIQSTLKVLDAQYDEPEPDAALTVQPASAYIERHPGPNDVSLIIEASDSTVRFDRATKAVLYAQAGILEYWVVDVVARRIYVHRKPAPEGYADIRAYEADENVSPLASPNSTASVSSLLPPAT